MNKKHFFLRNGRILLTSETLGVKTMYPRELIMKFKVAYNVVSDNFYIDQNTVNHIKTSEITISYFKILKLVNFFHYFF